MNFSLRRYEIENFDLVNNLLFRRIDLQKVGHVYYVWSRIQDKLLRFYANLSLF